MNFELSTALAPVLRDLRGPVGIRLKVVDEEWADLPGRATAMIWEPSGTGMGIQVELGRPLAAQIASVADQVQEFVVEALPGVGRPTNWPRCPHHPANHPAAAAERDGEAYWICPVLGETICGIGALGATGPG